MTLLDVRNLTVNFHTREGILPAINDVSFSMERSQTLGIVGESGSGKSVLCYCLLGLLPTPPAKIESGAVNFDSMDLLSLKYSDFRRVRGNRISMIFQDPMTSLNPYLTIGKQLIEPLRLHKKYSKKLAKLKGISALDEVGIASAANRFNSYPHELSGGMRQRVMIAMALISEPELLIADEPTTALDVTTQAQILDLIDELKQIYNISVIFVTHDLGVIAKIADHVLVMQNGQVVEQGSTEDIFYQTRHPYTKNLLDSISLFRKVKQPITPEIRNTGKVLSISSLKTHFTRHKALLSGRLHNQIKAIDDVSLDLYEGDILGLVGESGSGKSTLGRSVMRLLEITSGTIKLNNIDISRMQNHDLQPLRKEFQIIFQDPYSSLNPRMTIFDTLAEPVRLRGTYGNKAVLAEVSSLMKSVGIDPALLWKYPHEFSGGQRQRIAIARALAMQPKLIIADEPVSALDVTIQLQILELLLVLNKQHRITMLFISHDLSVIRYVSNRIAVILHGKIIETGETESIFSNPVHPYTQSLLSAIPVPDPTIEKNRKYSRYVSAV